MIGSLEQNRAARAAILALALAIAAEAAADKPKPRCLSEAPSPYHVDMEAGVFFTGTNWNFYATDVETGRFLWSRRGSYQDRNRMASIGEDEVLFYAGRGFVGVDKRTGRELWRLPDLSENYGRETQYLGKNGWFSASFYSKLMVFSPGGRSYLTETPFVENEYVYVVDWLEEGKTLVLRQSANASGFPNRISIYLWDLEHEPYKAFDLDNTKRFRPLGILPTGELVAIETSGKQEERRLMLYDPESGALLRSSVLPDAAYRLFDGYLPLGRYCDATCRLMDVASGEIVASLEAPGHLFYQNSCSESAGKRWILSVDAGQDVWLWPFENGAVPRKVENRRAEDYLPGRIAAITPPHVLVQTLPGQLIAFRLEDMQKAAEWRPAATERQYFFPDVSTDMTRAMAIRQNNDEANSESTEVYETGKPEPIAVIDEYPKKLSPDGRFVVVQPGYNTGPASIVEVDTGKVCAKIPVGEEDRTEFYFSPDSRYVVVRTGKQAVLVTLAGDYPRINLALDPEVYEHSNPRFVFSPDGTAFISQHLAGMAVLYDAESGEELRRFEETERIRERFRYAGHRGGGIWSRAKDFAEDLWKSAWNERSAIPRLEAAFSADGSRVITLGQGQIIRVWDAASGESLRAIHTGLPEKFNARNYIENRIVLSPNGAYAFAYNADGYGGAGLWDLATGTAIAAIEVPEGKVEKAAVAGDGSMVYAHVDDDLWFLPGKAQEE